MIRVGSGGGGVLITSRLPPSVRNTYLQLNIIISKGLELFEHEANARMGLIFTVNKIVLISLLCFFLTAGVMFILQITNNTESPGAKSFPGSKWRI